MLHSDREHAVWSASATERNWNCPGALALTMDLPERTSEAADWGTCAHQISERCLRSEQDAAAFIGSTEKGKKHEFEVDEEMAETAQTYIDYVRGRLAEYRTETGQEALIWIEQRFDLSPLDPPFEAGGTGDAVLYFPAWRLLEVVDLKGGRGVRVDPHANKQLRTYALGAMIENRGLKVDNVMSTVVQPRVSETPKSETFHVADLVEWTADLMAAMRRSAEALQARPPMTEAAWATTYLRPGPHCTKTFCKAAATCPALQKAAYDAAGVWFDDLDRPKLTNAPDAMSPEQIAQALDAADMIEGWINAVRNFGHAQAEAGVAIPEYVLVDRIGRRRWKVDETAVLGALDVLGVTDPYMRKLVSPAQAEKLVGAKGKKHLADLIEKPVTGSNLVRADKTTRPAIQPAVHQHFDVLD